MVAYAEALEEQMEDVPEVFGVSPKTSNGGQPRKSNSKVAERAGVDPKTVSNAKTHVAVAVAVAFPFMRSWRLEGGATKYHDRGPVGTFWLRSGPIFFFLISMRSFIVRHVGRDRDFIEDSR